METRKIRNFISQSSCSTSIDIRWRKECFGYLTSYIINILIGLGASVNAQGGVYENAFASAKQRGHETVAEILRKAGAK